jgi:signal transduction histidine kinase
MSHIVRMDHGSVHSGSAMLPAGAAAPDGVSALLPAILRVLPYAVAIVDARGGQVLAANAAWLEMARWRGGGGTLGSLFAGAISMLDEMRPVESGGAHCGAVAAADGAEAWFDLDFVAHPDDPRALIVTARDVTDAVLARRRHAAWPDERTQAALALQAEMQLRGDLQRQLLQAQKLEAIGQLAGSIAHDFNNVLAAISGSFSLIRRRAASDQVVDLVERGQDAVRRAKSLIDHLTRFVRQSPATPEMLDVRTVLPELEDLLGHTVRERAVCTFDIAADVWKVIADAHELGIALLNLVANSRDAMGDGGIITISARNLAGAPDGVAPGDYVAIAVRDQGEGMTPATLQRARDAFFTTKPLGKGTGLGLHMVQSFAAQCGGALRIDSALGVGTTVEIILPRAAVVTSSAERMHALRRISAPSFALHGDAAILLVEQDAQARPVKAAYLRGLGYTVVEAGAAEAAVVLAHARPDWDLLIADVWLPGAGGVELAARLRVAQPELPALFISGLAGESTIGEDVVLHTPFSDTALGKAVLRQLGRTVTLDLAAEPIYARLVGSKLQAALLAWHVGKADGEGYPAPDALNPAKFGLDANAFVAAIETSDPPVFRFVRVGPALTEALRRAQGDALTDPEASGEAMFGTLDGAYRRCARTRAPVYQSARYDFGDGAPVSFERLLLPASEDGETISHLVGIVLINLQPDQETP